jgi:hypothetical protein
VDRHQEPCSKTRTAPTTATVSPGVPDVKREHNVARRSDPGWAADCGAAPSPRPGSLGQGLPNGASCAGSGAVTSSHTRPGSSVGGLLQEVCRHAAARARQLPWPAHDQAPAPPCYTPPAGVGNQPGTARHAQDLVWEATRALRWPSQERQFREEDTQISDAWVAATSSWLDLVSQPGGVGRSPKFSPPAGGRGRRQAGPVPKLTSTTASTSVVHHRSRRLPVTAPAGIRTR